MNASTKTVWIINHYAVAPGGSGGTRHYDLAKQLNSQGFRVHIFGSAFGHQTGTNRLSEEDRGWYKEEVIDGITFVWFKTSAYTRNNWRRVKNMLDFTYRCYRYGRSCVNKPDIVIGSLMHPLAAWLGARLAKRHQAIFYFEERDLWPQTLIDFGKVKEKHPIVWCLYRLESYLYRKAKRIIVLFEKAPDYIEQRTGLGYKSIYLPNGVDISRFSAGDRKLPASYDDFFERSHTDLVAVYTGSHGISDGLELLLETARKLEQKQAKIRFLFVGEGPEKQRLVKLANEMGLNRVEFLPAIPKESIPTLLNRSDFGLLALKDAGVYKWGMSFNKFYDYMAAALPTMMVGSLEDSIIEREQIGAVGVSAEVLAEQMLLLMNQNEERIAMGMRARRYVERMHEWGSLSKRLADVMREDLNELEPVQSASSYRKTINM
ncbi:glycosyltransferase family 4 protein [Paenibacillus sp. GCM10027629]|uniref:glycosyltransferase family 4 protein n=1 Tax=Paenibacillus sp. GCM10027629 TaxID=3273414 RepID=UPI0036362094